MKLLVPLLAGACLLAGSEVWAAPRPKIALTEIQGLQGVSVGSVKILTNIVTSQVAQLGTHDVLSSADIAALIGFDRQKKLLSCTDDSACLAELGGALGVDLLLSGQVGKIGSRYHVLLTLADVRRAKVVARESTLCDGQDDALVDAMQKLVSVLLEKIGRPPPAPTAVTPTAVTQPAAVPPVAVEQPDSDGQTRRLIGWVTLGAGALLIGGGVLEGVSAKSGYDDLAQAKATLSPGDFQARWDKDASGVSRTALVADLLYGFGAVAVGTGLVLWLTAPSGTPVSVMPTASSHAAGLAVAGEF